MLEYNLLKNFTICACKELYIKKGWQVREAKTIKIFLTTALVLGVLSNNALIGASNFETKVQKLIKEKTKQDVEILRTLDLKSSKDIKLVIMQVGGLKVPIFVTNDGNVILGASNVFLSSDKADSTEYQNITMQINAQNDKPDNQAVAKLFGELKKDEFIVLDSKDSRSTKITYIVADPNCVACQKEIQNIESKLKDSKVYVLLVGFLGPDSALKSSMLKQRLLDQKDTAKKVSLLKEVFARGYQLPSKYKNADVGDIFKLSQKVTGAGIKSVPYIYQSTK